MKRYLVLLLLSFHGLWAQVQFETKVSKNTLGLNERLRVDFVMKIDGDNFKSSFFNGSSFKEPTFNGFSVIKVPEQTESRTWKNNKISSFEKVYSYILLPKKKGKLFIKKATIEYKGQVYKTSSVKVIVIDMDKKKKQS